MIKRFLPDDFTWREAGAALVLGFLYAGIGWGMVFLAAELGTWQR